MDLRKPILEGLNAWLEAHKDLPIEVGLVVLTRIPDDSVQLHSATEPGGKLWELIVPMCDKLDKEIQEFMTKEMEDHGRTHGVDPPSTN